MCRPSGALHCIQPFPDLPGVPGKPDFGFLGEGMALDRLVADASSRNSHQERTRMRADNGSPFRIDFSEQTAYSAFLKGAVPVPCRRQAGE